MDILILSLSESKSLDSRIFFFETAPFLWKYWAMAWTIFKLSLKYILLPGLLKTVITHFYYFKLLKTETLLRNCIERSLYTYFTLGIKNLSEYLSKFMKIGAWLSVCICMPNRIIMKKKNSYQISSNHDQWKILIIFFKTIKQVSYILVYRYQKIMFQHPLDF